MSHLILLFFILATAVSGEVYFSRGLPHVKLTPKSIVSGSIKYSRDGRPYSMFSAIPYASVPKRFAESQLITEPFWDGVKPFTEPGPVCPQQEIGNHDQELIGQEDCLVLNVNVPMNNTRETGGYPVMVFIHGGGFTYASGMIYSGKYIMDEDVILVTLNYRLGIFGFLSTGDTVVPGNNGLKDQLTGLKWVNQNIAKFGGNPEKITIFGESAGSASVNYLLLSPLANGLFQRAISQSASTLGNYPYDPNPKKNAEKLANHLGCATTSSEDIVTCLSNLSTEELSRAQFAYKSSFPKNLSSFNFMPTAEMPGPSAFLSVPPLTAFQTGTNIPLMTVPWILGVTEDEGCSWYAGTLLAFPELLQELDTHWESLAPDAFFYRKYFDDKEEIDQISEKLRKFYFGEDGKITLEKRKNLTNLYSDQLITHGVWRAAMESAKRGNTVYLYEYAYPGPMSLFSLFIEVAEEEKKSKVFLCLFFYL